MFKKKTPKERIVKYIDKKFSPNLGNIFKANIVEKIELDWENKITPNGICSKWGGYPDLPENTIWPENKNGKLDFLLQMNLEEFEGYLELLPKKGIISIFVDLKNLYSTDISNKEKIKVLYTENVDQLISNTSKKLVDQKEYKFEIIKSYSILPSDSPKLMGVEMNDKEYDNWDELNYEKIEKFVGGSGYISVGQNSSDSALYDWIEETGNKNVDDYFSMFEILLDVLDYSDCWLEIGILKEDLKQLNFDNALLATY